jgi:hypothetical protein
MLEGVTFQRAAFLKSFSLPSHYILDRLCSPPIHVKNEFFFWRRKKERETPEFEVN